MSYVQILTGNNQSLILSDASFYKGYRYFRKLHKRYKIPDGMQDTLGVGYNFGACFRILKSYIIQIGRFADFKSGYKRYGMREIPPHP